MQASVETTLNRFMGKVRDVMSHKVISAETTMSIASVTKLMTRHNLRRIVIVDRRQRVVGVVSQRDILRSHLSTEEQSADNFDDSRQKQRIQTLIRRDTPLTVAPDMPLIKAAFVLATNKIGCLPVVGVNQELLGILSSSDLLRRLTGQTHIDDEDIETTFQLYTPNTDSRTKRPAYIRKVSGELVIPMRCLEGGVIQTEFAVLGYDPPTGRILVKFVADEDKPDDALRFKRVDDYIVVPARGFVNHFDLASKVTAFDFVGLKDQRYLILAPRSV